MTMKRREFLGEVVGRPLVGLAVFAAACGGDDGAPLDAAAASCLANGTAAVISSNHGHAIMVTKEDVAAGQAKTYTLAGTDHTHTVMVTAAMFARLAGAQPAMTTSSVDFGHSHDINVRCV
jgi:hypothetical protein